MPSAVLLDGYLLKKKKASKTTLLGSKYQKRWFELTAETLAYAKDPKELKDGGGNLEVFGIHELRWVRKLDNDKLEVRFPERALRLRSESPGDLETWCAAIEAAHAKKKSANENPHAEKLKKLQRAELEKLETAGQNTSVVEPNYSLYEDRLSPRALLANPTVGSSMIAPPKPEEPCEDEAYEYLPRRSWHDGQGEDSPGSPSPVPQRSTTSTAKPGEDRLVLEQRSAASPTGKEKKAERKEDECLVLQPSSTPASKAWSATAGQLSQAVDEKLVLQPTPAAVPVARPSRPSAEQGGGERVTLEPPMPSGPARSRTASIDNARQIGGDRTSAASTGQATTSMPNSRSQPDSQEQVVLEQRSSNQGGGPSSSAPLQGMSRRGRPPPIPIPNAAGARTAPVQGNPGDDNWLDDDWDSSDEEQERQKKATEAKAAIDENFDSESEEGEEGVAGQMGSATLGSGTGRISPRGGPHRSTPHALLRANVGQLIEKQMNEEAREDAALDPRERDEEEMDKVLVSASMATNPVSAEPGIKSAVRSPGSSRPPGHPVLIPPEEEAKESGKGLEKQGSVGSKAAPVQKVARAGSAKAGEADALKFHPKETTATTTAAQKKEPAGKLPPAPVSKLPAAPAAGKVASRPPSARATVSANNLARADSAGKGGVKPKVAESKVGGAAGKGASESNLAKPGDAGVRVDANWVEENWDDDDD